MSKSEIEELALANYPTEAKDGIEIATFCLLVDIAITYLRQLEVICSKEAVFASNMTPLQALLVGLEENIAHRTGGR